MKSLDHKWRFEILDNMDKINFPKTEEFYILQRIYDNFYLYKIDPEPA